MSLAKIKVLDFTHLLPGEVTSTLFADMGAEILRVERLEKGLNEHLPPLVEGESLYFWSLHRNKKRIRVNLKNSVAVDFLKRLIRDLDIDVILENFRPGVMERLGLGYEALSAVNPRLVYCSISGYGAKSKWRNRPGHDLTFVAESGILHESQDEHGKPILPGVFISDYMSGTYGALAAVSALFERTFTGKGKHLEISMFESALSTLAVLGTINMQLGLESNEIHKRYPDVLPNHTLYRCLDGRYLACAPVEPQFWQAFLHLIDREDLLGKDPVVDKDFLLAEIAPTIAKKSLEDWMYVFKEADCCVSPVNTLGEALSFLPEGKEKVTTQISHPVLGSVGQVKSPLYPQEKTDPDSFCTDTKGALTNILQQLKLDKKETALLKESGAFEL